MTFIPVIVCVLVAGLSGCAILDPGPPPAQVILPVQHQVAEQADRMDVRVLVALPVADRATGTDRILALFNGYEVRALDQARWASPVPWIVQRLLIDALEASRRLDTVGWEESLLNPDIRVQTDIRRFFLRYEEPGKPPAADLMLSLSLVDMRTGNTIGRKVIAVEQQCLGNSLSEFVAAYSLGMAKVLGRSREWILAEVEKHLAETAPGEGQRGTDRKEP